jgi:hypothetical protein
MPTLTPMLPRFPSPSCSGSREKLMQCRRISMRDYCSGRLDGMDDPMKKFSTKRVNLITNFAKYLN